MATGTLKTGQAEISLAPTADEHVVRKVDLQDGSLPLELLRLILGAGTTAAGTAPLKFTAGPLMTTVEPGAMEYKGHTLYFTTYLVRRAVMLSQNVITARVQVPASSTTETTVYEVEMAANYLTAGKHIKIDLFGDITQRNAVASFYTIRLKYAGATILSWTTPASTLLSAAPFQLKIYTTCRSIGATGKLISYGQFFVQTLGATGVMGTEQTVDTTTVNTLQVTVQANENNASTGPVNTEIGLTSCVDNNT